MDTVCFDLCSSPLAGETVCNRNIVPYLQIVIEIPELDDKVAGYNRKREVNLCVCVCVCVLGGGGYTTFYKG